MDEVTIRRCLMGRTWLTIAGGKIEQSTWQTIRKVCGVVSITQVSSRTNNGSFCTWNGMRGLRRHLKTEVESYLKRLHFRVNKDLKISLCNSFMQHSLVKTEHIRQAYVTGKGDSQGSQHKKASTKALITYMYLKYWAYNAYESKNQ